MPTACRTLLVDAFTDEPLTGNPAGVVPDAGDLADEQMQAIARELGASETAFVCPSSEALHRVRYFTPSQEVDLCGHATVAAFSLLAREGEIAPGAHEVATNVGTVEIDVDAERDDDTAASPTVWLTGQTPSVDLVDLDYGRVGEALGIDPAALEDVGADLSPAVASTGLPWLCLPVNFLEQLGRATPQPDLVDELATEHDAAGVYAFTFDTLDASSALHARAFAPGIGVAEDPVTGTAAGACGAYLSHVDVYDDETAYDDLRFEQGHFVDRPGLVRVRVSDAGVAVGGTAITTLDGTLSVPNPDEDDIVVA